MKFTFICLYYNSAVNAVSVYDAGHYSMLFSGVLLLILCIKYSVYAVAFLDATVLQFCKHFYLELLQLLYFSEYCVF